MIRERERGIYKWSSIVPDNLYAGVNPPAAEINRFRGSRLTRRGGSTQLHDSHDSVYACTPL
jgi:hypothetical protein